VNPYKYQGKNEKKNNKHTKKLSIPMSVKESQNNTIILILYLSSKTGQPFKNGKCKHILKQFYPKSILFINSHKNVHICKKIHHFNARNIANNLQKETNGQN